MSISSAVNTSPSGLGGYLLAQGTLKCLGVAAEYGLVRVPEMNMSSTNTIVTILIVMITVLISYRLADKAQNHAYYYKDQEYKLNDQNLTFRQTYGGNMPDEIKKKIEENITKRDNEVTPLKRGWNELQRLIGREKQKLSGTDKQVEFSKKIDEVTQKRVLENLDVIIKEVKVDMEERAAELKLEDETLTADNELLELIGQKWIALHASHKSE